MKPLGKNHWVRIGVIYNKVRPLNWAERGFESLRRKFKDLYSRKKPTDDGEIPVHVGWAKAIQQTIEVLIASRTTFYGPDNNGDDDDDEVVAVVGDAIRSNGLNPKGIQTTEGKHQDTDSTTNTNGVVEDSAVAEALAASSDD
ncbi:hypothetical protein PHYPSEUDO_012665 [Phytophthora pseudosyringae]|uniref:DUF6818 domain-containing protein n=1 Tax=Phytophthora pseudosyringae TaxID=221518 RepID=A0A8T1V939_9STRA|nr:hypothetical protein PHYPSEUDO_012665 [Phytophthora pseudosyringae]